MTISLITGVITDQTHTSYQRDPTITQILKYSSENASRAGPGRAGARQGACARTLWVIEVSILMP